MLEQFYGREKELEQLRNSFERCAQRNMEGKFSGPQLTFVIAESGIGKSRLVQELYLSLSKDLKWDPNNYWPDSFKESGQQLRVTPDMTGQEPTGGPQFSWLGARWQPTDIRNIQDRRSALPDLQTSILTHATLLEQYGSVWSAAVKRFLANLKKDYADTIIEEAVGDSIPFAGILLKIAKGSKKLADDRLSGHQSFEEREAAIINDEVDEALEKMGLLLKGSDAIPTVLWLDDAQWIDSYTLEFLHKLWTKARAGNWPLFIVITHWEREWRELVEKKDIAEKSLCTFTGKPGVSELLLSDASDLSLKECLLNSLPGITSQQRDLLVEKAAGNYLTMVENMWELLDEPMWFVDENIMGQLTDDAVSYIQKFESERQKRVAQRFKQLDPNIRKLLGWSAQIGISFLTDVVSEYASEEHPDLEFQSLIKRCVDPYVILGKPSTLYREFRDKAFHLEAVRYKDQFLKKDAKRIMEVFSKQLSEWINNTFDSDGDIIRSDSERLDKSVDRNLSVLTPEESNYILEHAQQILVPTEVADWQSSEQIIALRTLILSVDCYKQSNQWFQVAICCKKLTNIDWHTIPASLVSNRCLSALLKACMTAGVFNIANPLSKELLERSQSIAKQANTPNSLLDLTIALDRVADIESAQGHLEAALEKHKESLAISRQLVDRVVTPESRRNLTVFLDRVADIEQAQGHLEAALEKYTESLSIRRQLIDELATLESQRDLALSLDRIADIESTQGHLEAALAKCSESLAIRRLLDDELSTPESQRDLTLSLNRVADIESAQGHLEVALEKYTESLSIRRQLVDMLATPQSRRDLAVFLDRVADIEQAQGRLEAALEKYTESLSIRRQLVDELTTPQSRRDLALSLDRVADIERDRGHLEVALAKSTESLAIRRLLADNLATPGSQRDLILSLDRVADIKSTQGHLEPALEKWTESLAISRQLVDMLATPQSRRDLSVFLDRVADIEQDQGHLETALEKYTESLGIRRQLANELATPGSHRDLALSLDRVADIESVQGHLEAALAKCTESLAIRRQLVDALATPQSWRDLTLSLDRVAGIKRAQGNLEAALEKCMENLTISRQLVKVLATPQSWRDLTVFLDRVADIEQDQGHLEAALEKYTESLDIRRQLVDMLTTPQSRRDLARSQERVAHNKRLISKRNLNS